MQVLHEKYGEDLHILAFPCNSFGGQEPKGNSDILNFAREKMGYKGGIYGKIKCQNGNETHPFFTELTASVPNGMFGQAMKWNFSKWLVDSNGLPYKRYSPQSSPLTFEDDIIELIGKK
jgi:glutathione peroxidase